jgi:hypothetical protein
MTLRQFIRWNAWFFCRWNEPSRSDWYAMQIAAEVRQTNSRRGVRPDQMRIPFRTLLPAGTKPPPLPADELKRRNEAAKHRWVSYMTLPPTPPRE